MVTFVLPRCVHLHLAETRPDPGRCNGEAVAPGYQPLESAGYTLHCVEQGLSLPLIVFATRWMRCCDVVVLQGGMCTLEGVLYPLL